MARLILDSTILIGAERSGRHLNRIISDEDDVAIAAVTAAELVAGIQLAPEPHQARRAAFVQSVLGTIPIEPYDLKVAEVHAELMAHVRRAGQLRGAHDLIVAATARARERIVVASDAAAFDDLPGVTARA